VFAGIVRMLVLKQAPAHGPSRSVAPYEPPLGSTDLVERFLIGR